MTEALERIADNIFVLNQRVSEVSSTVISLRELTDAKLEIISGKLDNSLKIHLLLKEEHEKHLQILTEESERNTRFRNNAVGAIKFTVWVASVIFVIAGLYITYQKGLI